MAGKRILVVYYSRTGTTKIAAEHIAKTLKCDIEEILDTVNRKGPLGFLKSGMQAARKKQTVIKDIKKDPSKYEIIIIGSPVWASNISSPVRTYMEQNKGKIKNAAFFCTMASNAGGKALSGMTEVWGKSPVSTTAIPKREIKNGLYKNRISKFINEITK